MEYHLNVDLEKVEHMSSEVRKYFEEEHTIYYARPKKATVKTSGEVIVLPKRRK